MNIPEITHKIKSWISGPTGQTVLLVVILSLSNISSFYLGRSRTLEAQNTSILSSSTNNDYSLVDPVEYKPVKPGSLSAAITASAISSQNASYQQNTTQDREESINQESVNLNPGEAPRYVASKNGRVYYFTWCTGAKRILEENRVYFKTAQQARESGLNPSTACPDLD